MFHYANPKLEFIISKQFWNYKTNRIAVCFAMIRKKINNSSSKFYTCIIPKLFDLIIPVCLFSGKVYRRFYEKVSTLGNHAFFYCDRTNNTYFVFTKVFIYANTKTFYCTSLCFWDFEFNMSITILSTVTEL